jgi:hypothetical protein
MFTGSEMMVIIRPATLYFEAFFISECALTMSARTFTSPNGSPFFKVSIQ